MSLRLVALSVDANDPLGLAQFWAEALRWELAAGTADHVRLLPTDGTTFRMDFLPVSEPKVGLNRLHLDLTSTSWDDQQHSVATLLDLSARHIEIGQRPDEDHVVLADPEGNEFCVIEPDNSFLAGCGRLGSITCDGTREVGYFWSAVFGWPLVWDQDDETAIRAADGTGPMITWGPPLRPKLGKDRLRLAVAPLDQLEQDAEVDRLVALGATRAENRPRRRRLGRHGRSRQQRVLRLAPRLIGVRPCLYLGEWCCGVHGPPSPPADVRIEA